MLVYVDSIILTGKNHLFVEAFVQALSHQFSLKELGNLNYFLGVEVLSTSNGPLLSQQKNMLDILERTKMGDAKKYPTLRSRSEINVLSRPFLFRGHKR